MAPRLGWVEMKGQGHMQARTSRSSQYDGLVGSSLGPYRLEQALETDELGAVFLARGTDSRTYRLRLLPISGEMSPQQTSQYLDAAQAHLMALASLKHPHILPLKDYGQWNGVPYLIYPYAPLRSVSALLAQNGPPDLQTLGRYLDQIASALEYAHEHGVIHGQLTTDHIYLQMDGQALVADLGVRHLIEMSGQSAADPLRFGEETLAPELTMGRHADTRTDVYQLGATLYRMLTAEPVFHGAGSSEITDQHVRGTPPRPSARRAGIPVEMDGLIAATLAKDPNRRPGQPGTVANAYADIVTPNNLARTPFVPTSGPAYRPPSRPSRTMARDTITPSAPTRGQAPTSNYSQPNYSQTSSGLRAQPSTVRPPRRPGRILLGGLLALGLVATAGLAAFIYYGGAGAGTPTAQVTFSEANDGRTGQTNALQITAEHLPSPDAGKEYDAWLIDTESENVLPLGALTKDGQTYTVRFSGAVNLVAAGNILEITQENTGVSVPVGKVIARGAWPDKALVHLRHVLTAYPSTPGNTALIAGVVTQSKLLTDHAKALQTAAGHDQATMLCETQVMINLLEGQKGSDYHALAPACATRITSAQGDGYGILGASTGAYGSDANGGYLPGALSHTSLATTVPDASTETKTHAQRVEATLGNIQTWDTILLRDLIGLQKTPSDTSKVSEIVTLAGDAYTGVDANNNGKIEPIEGEGGAVTAYQQAQLMATLTLLPVK
jgi:serine/threonine protein kinase